MSLSVQSIGVRQNPSLGLAQQNQSPSFKADMRPILHNTSISEGFTWKKAIGLLIAIAGVAALGLGLASGLGQGHG